MIRSWRAPLVALGAALLAAVGFAGPAAADVTVTPSEAPRGGPAELAFHIPDDRPGVYTTKVELVPPLDTPIAEIYPMSVNDWAPSTTTRALDHPEQLIMGTTTTEVPSEITWIRMGTPPSAPGGPIELRVSLGPMPDTSRVAFTIVQTYSDGAVARWGDSAGGGGAQSGHPAPTVTLVVDPAATGGGHDHGSGDQPGTGAAAAPKGGAGDTGGTYGILGAGLLIGLVAGLGLDAWIILRAVRRTAAGTTPTN